jgi:hypothetical protein
MDAPRRLDEASEAHPTETVLKASDHRDKSTIIPRVYVGRITRAEADLSLQRRDSRENSPSMRSVSREYHSSHQMAILQGEEYPEGMSCREE